MDITAMSTSDISALDFSAKSADEVTAAVEAIRSDLKGLFALADTDVTTEQVDRAEALTAALGKAEEAQAVFTQKAAEAGQKWAALKAAADGEDEKKDDEDEEKPAFSADADEDESDEDEDETDEDAEDGDEGEDGETEGEAVVTASAQRIIPAVSAAKAVGRKTPRPQKSSGPKVTITAAADVPKFATGQSLDGMEQVTQALLNRASGFAPFSERTAKSVRASNGGVEALSQRFGVATFGVDYGKNVTAAKREDDYNAVRAAIKEHEANLQGKDGILTAAGWCAPSETIYSYIADYVVDGLVSVPEVSAPRGGLRLTTGPAKSTQGQALEDFGFTQTEAQAIAKTVKTCEVIECPEFKDHRLDAIGYCYKIPFLTQKAYPELITDALRMANVLYAHKVNARVIDDMVDLSDPRTYTGYGPSFTDSLEALSILAVKERRKWNIGENAIMEVKVPVWAKEVFRADMSRRTGLALSDIATDQRIEAEFSARRLAVEYVADWQELTGDDIAFNATFDAMVYPSGTFIKAVEDVVNLSAVYDAASLSVNEYTGVFFEQGILVAKAGYGSSLITIPVNTAGETGAAILSGPAATGSN